MKKWLLLLLLPVSAQLFAGAQSDARMAALEARINYLEQRLNALENSSRLHSIAREHQRSNAIHICSTRAFGKTYEAKNRNEGLARSAARQACAKEQGGFFCKDENVQCKRYE